MTLREDVEITRRMVELILHEEDFTSEEFDEETLSLLREIENDRYN